MATTEHVTRTRTSLRLTIFIAHGYFLNSTSIKNEKGMRGIIVVAIVLGTLLGLCMLNMASSSEEMFTSRTQRRVINRIIEECSRSLAQHDTSPIMNIVHYTTARTWAQAALHLASEKEIQQITQTDVNHLLDQAQRKIDRSVKDTNKYVPRKKRCSPDHTLVH